MYTIYLDGICIYDPTLYGEEYALFNPKLRLSESNAGSLEFTMPPSNVGYDRIIRMKSEVIVYKNNQEIWSGRPLAEEYDFWNNKKVMCEGELAYLNDTTQPQKEYRSTVRGFLEYLINEHNSKSNEDHKFRVGSVTVTDNNDSIYRFTNYENTLEAINEKLVSRLGGHLRVRKENGVRYLDYLAEYPRVCAQEIRFAENLLDFTKSFDMSNYCTVLLPRGAQQEENEIEQLVKYLTIEEVNDGSPYLQIPEAVSRYGWIEKIVDWDDVTVPSNLKRKGQEYLNNVQFDDMKLTISAVDLHYLNPEIQSFELLDEVRCISAPHGLNKKFPVTQIDIPLDNPENTVYSLGSDVQISLVSTQKTAVDSVLKKIEELPTKQSVLSEARENASSLIRTATNGYITTVIKDGHAEELIISDEPDYTQADRVWRWNINGLGYSDNGIEGEYGLAITMNGEIVADFITAGTLNADIIRAGLIADKMGNNYWDLDTGEFKLSWNTEFGDTTIKDYTIDQIKDAIDALDIGTRNLLRFTQYMPITYDADTGIIEWGSNKTLVDTGEGVKCEFTGNSTSECIGFPLAFLGAVENDKDYTISFDYRGTLTSSKQTYFIQNSGANIPYNNLFDVTPSETEWQHVEFNFKRSDVNPRQTKAILFFYGNSEAGNWIEIKKASAKLETGNVASDWTPAPEDIIQAITDVRIYGDSQLNLFANTVNQEIDELQDQLDGNITTWYYGYEPTLENYPANEWDTDKDKNIHIGDLFYDSSSGKVYRFVLDGSKTVSGKIVEFDAPGEYALPSVKSVFKPVQNLNGYIKPWFGGAGKNLLPLTTGSIESANPSLTWNNHSTTVSGVTISIIEDINRNVDGIKVNGTATSTIQFFLTRNLSLTGDYILNGGVDNGVSVSVQAKGSSTGKDFNYTDDGTIRTAWIAIMNGTTANNVIVKPMIRLATVTDNTYEPYSNICPISGTIETEVFRTGKNLFGPTVPGFINGNDGTIASGSATRLERTTDFIPLKEGTSAIVARGENETEVDMWFGVGFYDENKNYLARPANQYLNTKSGGRNFTYPVAAKYARLTARTYGTMKIQFEWGMEPTEYEEPKGQSYPVTWGSTAGTVYSGYVDLVKGELVATHVITTFGESSHTNKQMNWGGYMESIAGSNYINANDQINIQCSHAKGYSGSYFYGNQNVNGIAAFSQGNNLRIRNLSIEQTVAAYTAWFNEESAKGTPVQAVIPLKEPTVYNLTPIEIKALTGINYMWSDSNDHIEVTYTAKPGEQEEGTYKWIQITDTDIAEAVKLAEHAQDTADGKRRVFITTPTPPYDVGDLWTQGSTGDVLTCTNAKAQGASYERSDWSKLNKYTDDSKAEEAISEIRSLEIGGRNWLSDTQAFGDKNTTGFYNVETTQSTLLDETYNGCKIRNLTSTITSGVKYVCYYQMNADLAAQKFRYGESYTFSFWAKGEGIIKTYFWGESGYVQVDHWKASDGQTGTTSDGGVNFTLTSDWTRYWVTYTLKTTGNLNVKKNLCIRQDAVVSQTVNVDVAGCKLEQGTVATDWTPAPEDVEVQVASSTELIVGTQSAATGAWTGNASFSKLEDKQSIIYWLPYAGSGNATLNLTLSNGQTTGAKNIFYGGTTRLTTHYPAGSAIRMVYQKAALINGSTYEGWWCDANYTDGNTYDRIRYNWNITAATEILNTRLIVAKADGRYDNLGAYGTFDISKPILYAAGKIAAGSTGSNNYICIPGINLQANKSGWTGENGKTVFLVLTDLKGNIAYLDTDVIFTTTIPTADDGKIYVALGQMQSTTNCYLYPEHPIYRFYNGKFQSTSQTAYEAYVEINDLEIGGRNLLGNTKNPSKPTLSVSLAENTFGSISRYNTSDDEFTLEDYDGHGNTLVLTSTVTGNRGVGWFTKVGEIRAGEKYTFSCRLKPDVACGVHVHTAWRNGSATAGYTGWTSSPVKNIPANEWTDYVYTFVPSANAQLDWEFSCSICFTGQTTGVTCRIAHAKLEKGTRATDWSPAPEDVEADIEAVRTYIDSEVSTIEGQIDKKIETFYQASDPSTSWTTTDIKNEHKGDIWVNSSTGKSYRWNGTTWDEMTTAPPSAMIDKWDGKAQIFISQPTPPYQKGDLWFNSTTSDIMTCITNRATGSYTASDWQKRNKYTDDTAVRAYIDSEISTIEGQLDKKIETFYQTTDPSSAWTTTDLKNEHKGDIWVNSSTGKSYRWNGTSWDEMTTAPPSAMVNKWDGKAQIFISQPTPPYQKGDLWFNSTTSEIKVCVTARATGSYTAADWEKRDKYTDDTTANTALSRAKTYFGTSSTGASTATKVVACSGFSLYEGAQIAVRFTNGNKATSNMALNVNSTGAKEVRAGNAGITASSIYNWKTANQTRTFVYDGTYWQLQITLDQTEVFNALTTNGTAQGIFMEDGKLYINMEYLKSGILKLGGNPSNGTLDVYTSDDVLAGHWDHNGLYLGNIANNLTNPNTRISTAGAITTNSLTAKKYINVDGDFNSYLNIPFYITGGNYYTRINKEGFSVKGSNAIIRMGHGALPEIGILQNDGDWVFGNVLKKASIQIADGSTSSSSSYNYINITKDGVYFYKYNGSSYPLDAKYTRTGYQTTGSKSRAIDTLDYGRRLLYCYETPTPLFGDIGEGIIGDDGKCYVQIDPVFSETVSLNQYQVFLQKYGNGECYITERSLYYFIVDGTPGLSFGWEIKAKQINYDQIRLNKDVGDITKVETNPSKETIPYEYEYELINHIRSLKQQREVTPE